MKLTAILMLFIGSLPLAWSQGKLERATRAPVVDAIVNQGEYGAAFKKSGAQVSLALSPDGESLYAAIEAPNDGWVAIGLGSQRMDGAFIVMGLDDGGRPVVTEQVGKSHSHSPSAEKPVTESAVRTKDRRTVMEFSVPASRFVRNGRLELIFAFGGKNVNAYHFGSRGSMIVELGG